MNSISRTRDAQSSLGQTGHSQDRPGWHAPPIVIFAYRRAEILRETLEGVRLNHPPKLIIFCDGAKNDEDLQDVADVRALVSAIDWVPTCIIQRPENLGLGHSVLTGVPEVFEEHEAAIFLEDDIVLGEGAYAWLSEALRVYRVEKSVQSVTAWTHAAILPDHTGAGGYFDGKAECWAWGAWRRSWAGMEQPADEILAQSVGLGRDVERYGLDIPIMAAEARARNLWAARWWCLHLLNQSLCLRPAMSMARHIGWDDRATTTVDDMSFWRDGPAQAAIEPGGWPEPVEHPQCAVLWQRATLASGAGPFPRDGNIRPRRSSEFELIYQNLALAGDDWTSPGAAEEIFNHILGLLVRAGVKPGGRILEFGCGAGAQTRLLAQAGYFVVAADTSPTALDLARSRLEQEDLTADYRLVRSLESGPELPNKTVDCVLDSLLLHNLIGIDRSLFLARARDALKEHGCLLVVTMCGDPKTPYLRDRFDHRTRIVFDGQLAELTFATPETLIAEIRRAGFTVEYAAVETSPKSEEDLFLAIARPSVRG